MTSATYLPKFIGWSVFELGAHIFHRNSRLSGYLIGCARTYLGMFRYRRPTDARGKTVRPRAASAIGDRFRGEP
jgi:hypothetical protein